jgi:hypothetical protein
MRPILTVGGADRDGVAGSGDRRHEPRSVRLWNLKPSATMRAMADEPPATTAHDRSRAFIFVGLAGMLLGAAAAFFLGPPLRREVVVHRLPPSSRTGQRIVQGPRWVDPEGSRDQLCFDRVEPAAFDIANGNAKAGAAALDAYVEFLSRQQREGSDERYRDVPYVVSRELGEYEVKVVVRPRSSADDIRPALRAATSIAAHMESMGYTSIRKFPCTVRVESEDIPSFFPKLEPALKALGLTAKEAETEEANAYWWGYEIRDAASSALKGLFFAGLSGNESSVDIIYYDLDHPFDWNGEEEWLMKLLSKMSGTTAVLRIDWIDPHVVVVGGRSSGGPCGAGDAMPDESKGK